MRTAFCETCGTVGGYRRALGWGTFFAVLVTLGVWLFALPFYPLRCVRCGTAWRSFRQQRSAPQTGRSGSSAADSPAYRVGRWIGKRLRR